MTNRCGTLNVEFKQECIWQSATNIQHIFILITDPSFPGVVNTVTVLLWSCRIIWGPFLNCCILHIIGHTGRQLSVCRELEMPGNILLVWPLAHDWLLLEREMPLSYPEMRQTLRHNLYPRVPLRDHQTEAGTLPKITALLGLLPFTLPDSFMVSPRYLVLINHLLTNTPLRDCSGKL